MRGQLVGGEGDRIPQSGSATRRKLAQGVRAQRLVNSEILDETDRVVDANDEGQVVLIDDYVLKKLGGSREFKGETVSDGCAGVDDETETQGKLGFIAESENCVGRLTIVANLDVRGDQICDGFAVIHGGEEDRDLVD